MPSHFKAGSGSYNSMSSGSTEIHNAPNLEQKPRLTLHNITKTDVAPSSKISDSNYLHVTSLKQSSPSVDLSTAIAKEVVNKTSSVSSSMIVPVATLSSVDLKISSTELVNSPGEISIGDIKTVTDGSLSTVDGGASAGPTRPAKLNSIIVSNRQKGNPILKFVRRVPWEFGDIVPDYQIGPTSCVLYLSLKYHNLNPNYIHERLKQLANSFNLRVLLAQVDVKDPHHCLRELASMCILADCTLILAFTPEEAGRYLETYKSFESKPPDLIMEKSESNYLAKITDTLTSVTKVNKTDAVTLLSAFGSFAKLTEVSEEDLSLCPGLGPQKARRLHKVFNQPFIKDRKSTTKTCSSALSS